MATPLRCQRRRRDGQVSYDWPDRDYLGVSAGGRGSLLRVSVARYVRRHASPAVWQLSAVALLGAVVTGSWVLLLLALAGAVHQTVVAATTAASVWATFAFLSDLAGPGLAALALDLGAQEDGPLDVRLDNVRQIAAALLLSRPDSCMPVHQPGCRHYPFVLTLDRVDRWWWHPRLHAFGRTLRLSLAPPGPPAVSGSQRARTGAPTRARRPRG